MIIQFDARKAKQGAGPTDHVWKIGLSGTELSALYGLMEVANASLEPGSPARALGENILIGLQAILDQCRAGKAHPIATILSHGAPEPSGLAEEIGAPDPGGGTALGSGGQAWAYSPWPVSTTGGVTPPPGSGAPATKAAPVTIPYPEHGDHAGYCPTT